MGRLLGLVLIAAAVASAAAEPAATPVGPDYGPELAAALRLVEWTPGRFDRLIREMPKAELHVHLDGSLAPETISRLAKAQGYPPLQDKSPGEIARLSIVSSRQPSLAKVLESFRLVYPLLRRADAVEDAAFELARAASKSRVKRMEVRFAPELQAAEGFSAEQALQAALAGLKRGEKSFGVKSTVILCLLRPEGLMPMAANESMLSLAIKHAGNGVVGVDVAGDEAAAPLSDYSHLLEKAKFHGLGVTVHAGEVPGSKDLATAVKLGADRIGHATLLSGDPDMLSVIRGRRIPIEVNLTSNLRTSAVETLKAHPAKQWRKLGMPLAVSTDDPGVFDVTLVHEYRLLRDELGFTPEDVVAVSLQAVDALFLPGRERAETRREFEQELIGLLGRIRFDKEPKRSRTARR